MSQTPTQEAENSKIPFGILSMWFGAMLLVPALVSMVSLVGSDASTQSALVDVSLWLLVACVGLFFIVRVDVEGGE